METSDKNLELCVKRTFYDVKDVDVEACKVRATKSDPRSDFSNRDLCSSISAEEPASVASNCSGPQGQQGRASSSMEVSGEVRPSKGKQLGDLPGNTTRVLESIQKNLELCVKRTFFHVKDVDVEACKMSASKSDPRSDFSNHDYDLRSSISTEARSSLASNCSFSQRQQGRASSSMEVGSLVSGEVDDLPGDITPTVSTIVEQVGPSDPFWSEGSKLHQSGQCRPCAWFFNEKGCSLARDCNFCHQCPDGQIRMKRKTKDAELRRQRREEERIVLPPGRVSHAAQSSQAGGHAPLPQAWPEPESHASSLTQPSPRQIVYL